jgi:membrane protease YdiL (CAAX protease family)
MIQLSKSQTVWYHLFPGILTTIGFVFAAPLAIRFGFPPMFGMLMVIVLVTIPVLIFHLSTQAKKESRKNWRQLNELHGRLPVTKLFMYAFALVAIAYIIWGMTQPVNEFIASKLLFWLPDWYQSQSLQGFDKQKVTITLMGNLLLNGVIGPVVEEIYFRGYLLPRMLTFGKKAFIINAVLFSVYHLWQPQIYLTLILALLPMTYLVYRTGDLRLAILTHSLLNIVGALIALAML